MSTVREENKQIVMVYYNDEDIKGNIKEILWGIEEEGIPYKLKFSTFYSDIDLGYNACKDSSFGVGIGISKSGVVLHYNKLDKEKPLYKLSLKSDKKKLRSIGANAARLVIKMPFKDI